MRIRARMSMSADGVRHRARRLARGDRRPDFDPGVSHGIREFLEGCEAALMGRTTFLPAVDNDGWPWPNPEVFVLGSQRPDGTPDHVVTDSDPVRLLDRMRAANKGGDVHLVGGPRTIETFRALGALDSLEIVVLPLLCGAGMRLTPALDPRAGLVFESQRALPGGSVEFVYSIGKDTDNSAAHDPVWSPASWRRGESA